MIKGTVVINKTDTNNIKKYLKENLKVDIFGHYPGIRIQLSLEDEVISDTNIEIKTPDAIASSTANGQAFLPALPCNIIVTKNK